MRAPEMPRASFAGVVFDFLLTGLEDRHEGMTTVREVPGGAGAAWIDLGGPLPQQRTATIKVDSETDYRTLAALPGTAGAADTLTSDAEGGPRPAVLLHLDRIARHGTAWQLLRTEWVFTDPGASPTLTGAGR